MIRQFKGWQNLLNSFSILWYNGSLLCYCLLLLFDWRWSIYRVLNTNAHNRCQKQPMAGIANILIKLAYRYHFAIKTTTSENCAFLAVSVQTLQWSVNKLVNAINLAIYTSVLTESITVYNTIGTLNTMSLMSPFISFLLCLSFGWL